MTEPDRSIDRNFNRSRTVSTTVTTTTDAPAAGTLPASISGDGTRFRLLRAGLELMFERGYHGTSIRDIAEGAGVQSATLYGHFPSKEALLAELVMLGHTEHHQRLVEALMDSGPDPRDQLRALVSAHTRGHAEFPMLATVANAELPRLSPEVAAPAHLIRGKSIELLMTVIGRGVRQGVFVIDHLEITLNAIATMGASVAIWHSTQIAHLDIATVCDGISDLALRMVQAPAPTISIA